MHQFGFQISCEWIENHKKVLKIVHGNEWFYLAIEGLMEVWKYQEVVSTRLEYLKYLNMKAYYSQVMDVVTSMEGDLKTNVLQVINGNITEHLCTMKEFILFAFERIKFDYELRKMLLS